MTGQMLGWALVGTCFAPFAAAQVIDLVTFMQARRARGKR